MKIIALILFLLIQINTKTPDTSLNKDIQIDFKNVSLKTALEKLTELSGIYFIYEEDVVANTTVNLEGKMKVRDAIKLLLTSAGLNYAFIDSVTVAITRKNKVKIENKEGGIKGKVKSENGDPLPAANVYIKELGKGCITDKDGNFSIHLKPGFYTLEISYVGYKKKTITVEVKENEITLVDCVMETQVFYIGAIEVVSSGSEELIPSEATTKTIITSAEVEHFQATSLNDVLNLVPGIQKTDNPGIGKTAQIAIRGFENNQMSAFGTLVIIDGAPLSNNANLQFQKWTSAITGPSNLGGSVDIRTIPADNIESIEVIRGIPSVKYGDMTSGVIIVNTKTGKQPHRVKIKTNPDTKEANLGGSFKIGNSILSYNLNLAQSERNIRLKGDEFSRLTGQITLNRNLMNDHLNFNTKLLGQKIFDEEQPKGDVYKTRNYNRGYLLQWTIWGKYNPEQPIGFFEYNIYVTRRRENSMKSRLVQSDVRILPTGDTVSSYIGKVETRGVEWTTGARFEYNRIFSGLGLFHKLLIGLDLQYNANTGEGVIIDTLFNYYGPESGKLPYRFDDIPGQFLPSLYLEDKITGKLFGINFSLTAGFRYEMYRPYKINLKGLISKGNFIESYNGTYFNPRGNIILFLPKENQIRISAGVSSKSPPMSSIYPEPTVIKWRNPNDSSIVYIRPNTRNPYLKGYIEKQFEIGYDKRFGKILGLSISAYYKYRNDEISSQTIPIFFYDSLKNKVYYIDKYGVSQNLGWSIGKGIEFTLRTSKIEKLNMEIQISGAYTYLKNSSRGFYYDSNPDITLGRYPNYKVPNVPIDTLIGFIYDKSISWRDVVIVNYFLKWTVKKLGLWVTFRAENVLVERTRTYNLEPIDFNLPTVTEDTKRAREFDESIKTKPSKWLLSFNITQSIFKGAEISFYVNNFLDDPAVYRYYTNYKGEIAESTRNPSLFYGIEISIVLDDLAKSILKNDFK